MSKIGVPPLFLSDGCTFSPDRLFRLNIRPHCRTHDFLRTYRTSLGLTIQDTDRIFHRELIKAGAYRWVARLYWFGVKVARPFFSGEMPLPEIWSEYKDYWSNYL